MIRTISRQIFKTKYINLFFILIKTPNIRPPMTEMMIEMSEISVLTTRPSSSLSKFCVSNNILTPCMSCPFFDVAKRQRDWQDDDKIANNQHKKRLICLVVKSDEILCDID